MTEAQEQKAVIDWSMQPHIRSQFPELALLHHIPNGGKRDRVEALHMKQQGVKRGVPDLCLPVPRGNYHGLYIEMKTKTGKASMDQVWWLGQLASKGYCCNVCKGWEAAVEMLTWYLELKEVQT